MDMAGLKGSGGPAPPVSPGTARDMGRVTGGAWAPVDRPMRVSSR